MNTVKNGKGSERRKYDTKRYDTNWEYYLKQKEKNNDKSNNKGVFRDKR